jgi:N-acetyl-1-D-myo-inositol-2-amino-2-deoxy-alpha-D-glucopyranoside deacetylase
MIQRVFHRQAAAAAALLVFMLLPASAGTTDRPAHGGVVELLQHAERVLWVGAHPDDETAASVLLARIKDAGGALYMATLTHGENSDKVWEGLRRGSEIGKAREALFARSAAIFGAAAYDIGPFVNGPHTLEELDALPATAPFRDWPAATTSDDVIAKWMAEGDPLEYLVTLLRRRTPDVVVSIDDYCGVSGHDEHIATGKLLLRAIPLAADPSAYPQGGEPWHVRHVIQTADILKPVRACRFCKCEGSMPAEPVEDVFTLEKSPGHQLLYLGVQCLIGRNYQNAMEAKRWTDQQMRAACEQIQSAAKRVYRTGVKGQPFFESFRYRPFN